MREPSSEVGERLLGGRASSCREGPALPLEGQEAGSLTRASSGPASCCGFPIVPAKEKIGSEAERELWQLPGPGAQRLLQLPLPRSRLA